LSLSNRRNAPRRTINSTESAGVFFTRLFLIAIVRDLIGHTMRAHQAWSFSRL
jgi:hypothetical protein